MTKNSSAEKPEVNVQGKAVVDSYSDGYFLMLPDGVVNWYTSKAKIKKTVTAWAREHSDSSKLNVCQIEWR